MKLATASKNSHHPLHYTAEDPNVPTNIKTTLSTCYYTQILPSLSCLHVTLTSAFLSPSLPHEDSVHLPGLWCGHHPGLTNYLKRLEGATADAFPKQITALHTLKHIVEDCNAHNLTLYCTTQSLTTLRAKSIQNMTFFRDLDLFCQAAWETTYGHKYDEVKVRTIIFSVQIP